MQIYFIIVQIQNTNYEVLYSQEINKEETVCLTARELIAENGIKRCIKAISKL